MPKSPQIPTAAAPKAAPAHAQPAATVPPKAQKPIGLPQDVAADDAFEEDFLDTKSAFVLIEPGFHHAKLIDFEKSESKGGNPQYVWQFRITAGQFKDAEIRFWTSLLPQARWKTAETLEAIGIEAMGSIVRFSKKDLLGRPCILEVIHDNWDNKLNHKIQRVHPPSEESVKAAKASSDGVPF